MALSPLARPAESTQVLRYRGQVLAGGAVGTYPKAAGVYPTNSTTSGSGYFIAWVRFPLWDAVNANGIDDTTRRLPAFVYDDHQPVASAPHDPVPLADNSPTLGLTKGELCLNSYTWAQNLEIHFNNIDLLVQSADVGVSVDANPVGGAIIELDTLSSGLGLNTGLPVVCVPFTVTANDGALQPFNIDLTFEVRHSNHR